MKKRQVLKLDDKELDKLIKIQGTQYDRKRKLTDKQIESARELYAKYDATVWDLAVMFGVSVRTIRYNLQTSYREHVLAYAKAHPQTSKRQYDHTAALSERAKYKRKLVARGKVCCV